MGFTNRTYNWKNVAKDLGISESDLKNVLSNNSYNGFAKVWKYEDKGNYGVGQISVSKKNEETNQYKVEFQDGFVRFVGNAHKLMNETDIPENGLTIQISSCDVTNHYDKEKKITYTNYVIFGFELPNNESESSSKPAKKSAKKVEEDDTVDSFAEAEDDLPF